jgi:hypothetical protein
VKDLYPERSERDPYRVEDFGSNYSLAQRFNAAGRDLSLTLETKTTAKRHEP